MGLDVALELLLGGLERGRVKREAGQTVGKLHFMDVEGAIAAVNDGVAAADQARRPAFPRRLDLGAVEELDVAGNHHVDIARFDRLNIAAVDPDDIAFGRAQPNGQRFGIEDGAQARHLLAEPTRVIGKLGRIAALARERPQSQRREAA